MLGILSHLSSGPCVTQVFCQLSPVDHVLHGCSVTSVQWTMLHGCSVTSVQWTMCYTWCSVTFVQWTMCYTGVLSHLSIGPCVTQVFCPLDHVLHRCCVTSVQCTLWYTGVLSSGPCDTHTFCHICPVDHVVCRCSVTCVHLRRHICPVDHVLLGCSVTASVQLTMCVLHRVFGPSLCQWTMCVT